MAPDACRGLIYCVAATALLEIRLCGSGWCSSVLLTLIDYEIPTAGGQQHNIGLRQPSEARMWGEVGLYSGPGRWRNPFP